MSKGEKNKVIPRIRFPEFQNIGGWEEKKLHQVGDFIGGGTPDTDVQEYWNGDIQWYTPTEIKERYPSYSIRTISKEGLKNSSAKLLPTGTLLISTRATIGDISIAIYPCATNQGFQSFVVSENQINIFWYYWFLQHRIELIKRASGSTFLELGKTEIEKITAYCPGKGEQQKIAECLSSIDDLIAAQRQKVEALKAHKRGLLQQLFPGGGENVPKLRFSEFEGDGEWEEKTIGSISEVITGSTPSKNDEKYWGGDFVWVTAQDFKSKYITTSELKLTVLGKTKSRVIPINSILVTCIASIGLNGINKVECATNQQINAMVCNSNYYFEFVYYAIIKNNNRLVDLAGQTAVPIVNKSVFEGFSIMIPRNRKEQHIIADCLSSADELIQAQCQKLESLKIHKKGLMQGLFPNINQLPNE